MLLSLLNPPVLRDPSQHHAVSRPLPLAHRLPGIILIALFSVLLSLAHSSLTGKRLSEVSLNRNHSRQLVLSLFNRSYLICTQGMFSEPNVPRLVLYGADCAQLYHALGDSASPKAKSLILLQIPSYCYRTP